MKNNHKKFKVFANSSFFSYFLRGLQSHANNKMIFLSIFPLLCAIVIWVCFFVFSINNFHLFIQQFPHFWIEYSNQTGALNSFSYFILIVFACISMILYGTIIAGVCMTLLGCFLSPFVVSFVHKNYFPYLRINPPSFIESFKKSSLLFLTTLLKFVIFSAICYCFSFIGLGLIGLILSIFIYFRFFSININHEIASSIMQFEECELCMQYNKIPLFFINVGIFIPLYIPILNLFIMVWQMLVLSHFFFEWYAKYCTNTHKDECECVQQIIEIKE